MKKLFWSRIPGKFVNKETGEPATIPASICKFTGSVEEWYETLVETIRDLSLSHVIAHGNLEEQVTVRISPTAHSIVQCSVLYRLEPQLSAAEEHIECIGKIDNMIFVEDQNLKRNEIVVDGVGSVIILDIDIISS